MPYITGGLGADWLDVVHAVADAGADAVEIGIPFSDPVMDGVTIQEASQRALEPARRPRASSPRPAPLDFEVPLAVMTYTNPVGAHGLPAVRGRRSSASGIAGAIVPDLPLDELDGWADAADAAGVETVLLAAPTTPDDRLPRDLRAVAGFVYGVSLMGVTGERGSARAARPREMGRRCKAVTDKPVLLGVGISTAGAGGRGAQHADGVIVGSALVRTPAEGRRARGGAHVRRRAPRRRSTIRPAPPVIKYLGSKRRLVPVLGAICEARARRHRARPVHRHHARRAGVQAAGSGRHRGRHRALRRGVRPVLHRDRRRPRSTKTISRRRSRDLESLPGEPGYFTETFCERSRFFQPFNGARVDAIRDGDRTRLRRVAAVPDPAHEPDRGR